MLGNRLLEVTLRRPPTTPLSSNPQPPARAWFPQNPLRFHGAERICSQTAVRCQLAEAWLHNLPKLSECVFKRAGAVQQKHSTSHWTSPGSNLGGAEEGAWGLQSPTIVFLSLDCATLSLCGAAPLSTECCACRFENFVVLSASIPVFWCSTWIPIYVVIPKSTLSFLALVKVILNEHTAMIYFDFV